jgi:hypothetical protein
MQGIARLSRHGDFALPLGMPVLAVASARARELPAVALEQADDLGDLQRLESPPAVAPTTDASAALGANASAISFASCARGAKCR